VTGARAAVAAVVAVALAAGSGCRQARDGTVTLQAGQSATPTRRDEPPVALNADIPAEYPPALAQQRIGGTVILRLFVSEAGGVVAESTTVQESSGYPALDSAALAAAPRLRYAPALREGRPVATLFLQPFNFRPPPGGGTPP
jgi:TonB family protein